MSMFAFVSQNHCSVSSERKFQHSLTSFFLLPVSVFHFLLEYQRGEVYLMDEVKENVNDAYASEKHYNLLIEKIFYSAQSANKLSSNQGSTGKSN
jgi:hypothetical protein